MSESLRLLIAARQPAAVSSLLRTVRLALGREIESQTLTTLAALRARLGSGEPPEIIVVDSTLEGFDRGATLAELQRACPGIRVVVLVDRAAPREEAEFARAGARAVVSWTASPRLTGRVLEIVASGSSYLSTAALLATAGCGPVPAVGSRPVQALPSDGTPVALTEHEARILAHIRRGESNRVIGAALGLDENRVKIHLRSIFRKTGARNRTEAALRAPLAGMAAAVAAVMPAARAVLGMPRIPPAAEAVLVDETRAIA